MQSRWGWARALGIAACIGASLGCGGAGTGTKVEAPSAQDAAAIDADPVALVPPGATEMGNVLARVFFGSSAIGAQVGTFTEQVVPIDASAGFVASRDVDRIVLASWGVKGDDVAAIVVGRFDVDKIAKAAEGQTLARAGGHVGVADYAGHKVYTVKKVSFAVLTPRTAVVGTDAGVHRVLDRVGKGTFAREATPWMVETIETPRAAAAFAADFTKAPLGSVSVGAFRLPWLEGTQKARAVAELHPDGLHVTGALSYGDAAGATRAADGMRSLTRLASLAAAMGAVPKLQDLAIDAKDSDAECSFAVDDNGLRKILALAPQFVQSGQ